MSPTMEVRDSSQMVTRRSKNDAQQPPKVNIALKDKEEVECDHPLHPSKVQSSSTSTSGSPFAYAVKRGLGSLPFHRWPLNMFDVDLRSLALFRMMLAGYVLTDLILQWHQIPFWYTDNGMIPRKNIMNNQYTDDGKNYRTQSATPLHIHLISGNVDHIRCIFVVHWLIALCMFLGVYTQTTTILTAILQRSLVARAPSINNKGGELEVLLLIWATVVPVGAVWSVDCWHRNITTLRNQRLHGVDVNTTAVDSAYQTKGTLTSQEPVLSKEVSGGGPSDDGVSCKNSQQCYSFVSLATIGLYYQAISLYIGTIYMKTGWEWKEGYAAHAAVIAQSFLRDNPFARFLQNNPLIPGGELMGYEGGLSIGYMATFLTIFLEKYVIWGLILPPYIKLFTIVGMTGMQMSFFASLWVYLFPVASTAMLSPLIPSFVWDRLLPKTVVRLESIGASLALCVCVILSIDVGDRQPHAIKEKHVGLRLATIRRWRHWLLGWLKYGVYIVSVLCIFVPTIESTLKTFEIIDDYHAPVKYVGTLYGSTQNWPMFCPGVKRDDSFIYLPGVLQDGTEVDAWPILMDEIYSTQELVLEAAAWNSSLLNRTTHYDKRGYSRWPHQFWMMHTHRFNVKKSCDKRCDRFVSHVCQRWQTLFQDQPNKTLVAFKLVTVVHQGVRGNCAGCMKKEKLKRKLMWQKGCMKNIFKPPSTFDPPSLKDLYTNPKTVTTNNATTTNTTTTNGTNVTQTDEIEEQGNEVTTSVDRLSVISTILDDGDGDGVDEGVHERNNENDQVGLDKPLAAIVDHETQFLAGETKFLAEETKFLSEENDLKLSDDISDRPHLATSDTC